MKYIYYMYLSFCVLENFFHEKEKKIIWLILFLFALAEEILISYIIYEVYFLFSFSLYFWLKPLDFSWIMERVLQEASPLFE